MELGEVTLNGLEQVGQAEGFKAIEKMVDPVVARDAGALHGIAVQAAEVLSAKGDLAAAVSRIEDVAALGWDARIVQDLLLWGRQ
jgi:hypothetical protein